MSRSRDPHTMDLLTWEPPQVAVGYAADVSGRGPLENKIARLISRALRDARDDRELSRADIARRMTDFLGRSVSVATLDKWSSEGSEDHRIPLDAFIALIDATGAKELLGFVPGLSGFAVIPEKYVGIVELHQLEEHEAEVAARKAQLTAKLRGVR